MARISGLLSEVKPQVLPGAVYLFYLSLLPAVVKRFTPCMNFRFGVSYTYAECNTALILDRFILFALSGFAVVCVSMLFLRKRKTLLPLTATAVLIAAVTVAFYYLYIPQAEAAATNAPILLESLLDR